MVVVGHLIGEGEVGWIEDPRLTSEQLQQACRFLDDQTRIGAFAKAAVKEQDPWWRIQRAESQRRPTMQKLGPERRKARRIDQLTQPAHAASPATDSANSMRPAP